MTEVNLHDWIDQVRDLLHVELDLDEALILEVAKYAAHNVTRPAAPLATFLVGYAAGRAGGTAEDVKRLALSVSNIAINSGQQAADGQ